MPTVVGIRFKKACKIYYFDEAHDLPEPEAARRRGRQEG